MATNIPVIGISGNTTSAPAIGNGANYVFGYNGGGGVGDGSGVPTVNILMSMSELLILTDPTVYPDNVIFMIY